MNKDDAFLSDYQQAALGAMGIPVWRLRKDGLQPVQQGTAQPAVSHSAQSVPENAEQPESLATEKGHIAQPEQVNEEAASAQTSLPGQLLMLTDVPQDSLFEDILQALGWENLPLHQAASESLAKYCDQAASWQSGSTVALTDCALTAPAPDQMDTQAKRQLWQAIVANGMGVAAEQVDSQE